MNCKQGWKFSFEERKGRFCGDRYNLPVLINDGLIDVLTPPTNNTAGLTHILAVLLIHFRFEY